METKLTEVQKLQATISHLCEESSEVVSDQIDPMGNVNWMRCSPDLPKYVQKLESEVESLRDALRKYGQHVSDCRRRVSVMCECNCGFNAALKEGK